MKKSRWVAPKYLIILTSCLDGCCTSQYSKESFIEEINIVDKIQLKKELVKILKSWERSEDEQESEDILEKKYEAKITIGINTGIIREDTSCGCFQSILIKKTSELPSTDRISIN